MAKDLLGTSPLARARIAEGLSQAGIATQLGMSQQGYRLIEHGRSDPSTERAERLAVILGRSVSEVVELLKQTREWHRRSRRRRGVAA